MASHTLTLGALLGLIVSGVSAYTAHRDYVTNGEGSLQLDSEQIRRDARVGADYALELQRKCLAQEPRYVCDQKSYEELYRGQCRISPLRTARFPELGPT